MSIDYLLLLNGLARRVKPARSAFRDAAELDEKLADTGLDSLDTVLMTVYLCEMFGIPEKIGNTLVPVTFADVVSFIEANRTRMPDSVDAALATVDG